MEIRPYQPGDEAAQAAVFNASAASLPGFKTATADEIARRHAATAPDPEATRFAVERGRVVGYALFNPNGRISYPWCLPGFESCREPLLEAVLGTMARRGLPTAWATYRADWGAIVAYFERQGFVHSRSMINYLADVGDLPTGPPPEGTVVAPISREEFRRAHALGRGLFDPLGPDDLAAYYWENPYFGPASLFALNDRRDGRLRGLGVAITDPRYADPTKIDPAMPCFRLGTLGTETQRHKRVVGLVSVVFEEESDGATLLAEAARRLSGFGQPHAATQAPSDRP